MTRAFDDQYGNSNTAIPPRHPLARLLSVIAWPGAVCGLLSYYIFYVQGDPATIATRVGLPLLGMVLFGLLLEQLIPLRADWNKAGDGMIPSDFLHAVFQVVVLRGAELVFPIAVLASIEMVGAGNSLGLWPVDLAYPVQVLLFVFLADGVGYWMHRLTHEVSWLWPIHVVHHAPDRLNILKAPRHHAAYMVLRHFVVFAPFVLIGTPPGVVIWYVPILALFGPLSHANADLRVPHWLDRILLTPQVHQLHHSIDMRLGNSNYAVIFPIWDVIFGTFSDPAKEKTEAVGVSSEPLPRGFIQDIIRPFVPKSLQSQGRAVGLGQLSPGGGQRRPQALSTANESRNNE